MRWRFTDRINSFEPWRSIRASKAISLEEYSLLKPFGRKGDIPESLVLECCVHTARWLVVRSSEFQASCILHAVQEFDLLRHAGMGDRLDIEAHITGQNENSARFNCRVQCSDKMIAGGCFTVVFMSLDELQEPDAMRIMWKELHATP